MDASVIIPCFNGERFIGNAIASALGQTYPRTEVIVIDDGSTDNSLDVIRSFGGSVRWESGPRRGGSQARNRGLASAKGQFIQFLDADDKLFPAKLERQIEQLQSTGADVCLAPFDVISTDGTTARCGPLSAPIGDPFEWILFADARITPLYRSTVIACSAGFDSTLTCCQDLDLALRIALAGARYAYVDDPGYQCRRHAASVSSDETRLYRVMIEMLARIARQLPSDRTHEQARREALAAKITNCARWLLRLGDTDGGMHGFAIALDVHQSGGLNRAYSTPALWLRHCLGPSVAEQLLCRGRSLYQSLLPNPLSIPPWP